MKFYRRDEKLFYGENFEDAMLFADYLNQLDGEHRFDYSGLLKETDVDETTLEDTIAEYLRDEMSEDDLISNWNDYIDTNKYEERIDYYNNARDYVEMMYCDSESMLEALDRLYSSNVPYYGKYIIEDYGSGERVGYFEDVWDERNYEILAEWLAEGNNSTDDELQEIIDEFEQLEETYDDEHDSYVEWLEERETNAV